MAEKGVKYSMSMIVIGPLDGYVYFIAFDTPGRLCDKDELNNWIIPFLMQLKPVVRCISHAMVSCHSFARTNKGTNKVIFIVFIKSL
jgi:hypothetical protein